VVVYGGLESMLLMLQEHLWKVAMLGEVKSNGNRLILSFVSAFWAPFIVRMDLSDSAL
jgi:hypothetical protein